MNVGVITLSAYERIIRLVSQNIIISFISIERIVKLVSSERITVDYPFYTTCTYVLIRCFEK